MSVRPKGFEVKIWFDIRKKRPTSVFVERPVTDPRISRALRERYPALELRATSGESDYGGLILRRNRRVGAYLIVPGSERA